MTSNELMLLRWLIDFLGELTGIAVALVYITIWIGTAGPLQEMLTEKFIDRKQGTVSPPNGGATEVLVSDLHIDTWDYPGPRAKNFPDFLDAVREEPSLQGFIMNGDLMDIPLFAGGPKADLDPVLLKVQASELKELGVLSSQYDEVLGKLLSLETPSTSDNGQDCVRRAIFQTGNHDIGVCGLRYTRDVMPSFLPPVRISWNPEIMLRHGPENDQDYDLWTYIEHGHRYDPLLWLYMRYAVLDTLRGGQIDCQRTIASAFQRNGRIGMGRSARGTGRLLDQTPQGEQPGSAEHPPAPAPDLAPVSDWDFAGEKRTFLEMLIVYRFRQAARRAFRILRKGDDVARLRIVTFGHTHMPDRYVFPNGDLYVNSGDWCGLTPHQCYSLVHEDGSVRGPFQWVDKARFQATLKAPAAHLPEAVDENSR